MVEAWLEIPVSGTEQPLKVPCLMPTDEILELMRCLGYTDDDAFCVEIPAGLSRPGRFRFLLSLASVKSLADGLAWSNGAAAFGAGMQARFKWWARGEQMFPLGMNVVVMPPKPLLTRVSEVSDVSSDFDGGKSRGVFMCEAFDWRYAMTKTARDMGEYWVPNPNYPSPDRQNNPVHTTLYSPDGRRVVSYGDLVNGPSTTTVQEFADTIRIIVSSNYPVVLSDGDLTNVPAILNNRIANLTLYPECSIALAYDVMLASVGHVLVWKAPGGNPGVDTFEVVPAKDLALSVNIDMASTDAKFLGGNEPWCEELDADEDETAWVSQFFVGQAATRFRASSKFSISFPYRQVEGKTLYGNAFAPGSSSGWSGYVNYELSRERPSNFAETQFDGGYQDGSRFYTHLLKEPRAICASAVAAQENQNTTANMGANAQALFSGSQEGRWDDGAYMDAVADLVQKRKTIVFNDTLFAGWQRFDPGCFYATMLRYSLGRYKGQLVPLTKTVAKWEDWIFGPNGDLVNDPRELVMSRGMVHARRVGVGMLDIEVPPPNCRVFPAKILSSVRVGQSGNDYWKWKYQWEEVEPEPIETAPTPYDNVRTGFNRKSNVVVNPLAATPSSIDLYARNLMENGNVFVSAGNAGNVIAPGVNQADFADSTVSAEPIKVGTIVTMVEQALIKQKTFTVGGGTVNGAHHPQFWFSVPNPVKVECL